MKRDEMKEADLSGIIDEMDASFERQEHMLEERVDHLAEYLERGEALHFRIARERYAVLVGEAPPEAVLTSSSKVLRKLLGDIHAPSTTRLEYGELRFNPHPGGLFFMFSAQPRSRWAREHRTGQQEMDLRDLGRRVAARSAGLVDQSSARAFWGALGALWSNPRTTSEQREGIAALLPGMRLRGPSDVILIETP